ncbi:hypothetical protein APY03_2842 [Variovorax sp. WDL1]|nr:hypothetical protein APY03_2842 [Variovorax sp. WDL1]
MSNRSGDRRSRLSSGCRYCSARMYRRCFDRPEFLNPHVIAKAADTLEYIRAGFFNLDDEAVSLLSRTLYIRAAPHAWRGAKNKSRHSRRAVTHEIPIVARAAVGADRARPISHRLGRKPQVVVGIPSPRVHAQSHAGTCPAPPSADEARIICAVPDASPLVHRRGGPRHLRVDGRTQRCTAIQRSPTGYHDIRGYCGQPQGFFHATLEPGRCRCGEARYRLYARRAGKPAFGDRHRRRQQRREHPVHLSANGQRPDACCSGDRRPAPCGAQRQRQHTPATDQRQRAGGVAVGLLGLWRREADACQVPLRQPGHHAGSGYDRYLRDRLQPAKSRAVLRYRIPTSLQLLPQLLPELWAVYAGRSDWLGWWRESIPLREWQSTDEEGPVWAC